MTPRRAFDLLPEDETFLAEYGKPWETLVDGSQWVLVHDFSSQHDGYNHQTVIVAVRLETGYPVTGLDMVYVYPPLSRKDGKPIRCADVTQQIDNKPFQRWSRHRTAQNPWKQGQDNLGTHILLIEDWFAREFET